MTMPGHAARETLFKAFGRAFFRRDVEALYDVVTPDFVWSTHDGGDVVVRLFGRDAVAARLQGSDSSLADVRFHDVVYHHADDATFMTFRLTATERATGQQIEQIGIERYTFRDGRIATKDVYRKPAA